MNTVKIEGTKRDGQGKKNSSDLRSNNLVPCNLYGVEENMSFTITSKDVRAFMYSPEFRVAEIALNGKEYKAIIREIQLDPLTEEPK